MADAVLQNSMAPVVLQVTAVRPSLPADSCSCGLERFGQAGIFSADVLRTQDILLESVTVRDSAGC